MEVKTTLERFEEKYIPEPNSGCWLWTAATNGNGYGVIRLGPRPASMGYAHRVSYELHKGPIPEGLVIDHLCRVTLCVNPDHLEVVTHRENLLRGVGFSAVNAKKTHCLQGHPLSGDNLLSRKDGSRCCRTCHNARRRTS